MTDHGRMLSEAFSALGAYEEMKKALSTAERLRKQVDDVTSRWDACINKYDNIVQSQEKEIKQLRSEKVIAVKALREIRDYYQDDGYYGFSVAHDALKQLGVEIP